MKALANTVTGKITDVHESGTPVAGPDQVLVNINPEALRHPEYFQYVNGQVVEKSAEQKALEITIYKFSADVMTAGLGLIFTGASAIALCPYLGALQSYAKAKNFTDLKAFLGGLVALGKATQEQANAIKAVILEQGINLDNF